MPINSRNKGAAGEREFARLLTAAGFPAERGVQHAGGVESPDVRCPSLPVHWEVKRMKACEMSAPAAVAGWRAQAERDAAGLKLPVIAHRWNNGPWWVGLCLPGLPVVWLRADEFLKGPVAVLEALT